MGRIIGALLFILAIVSAVFVVKNYWPAPDAVNGMGHAIRSGGLAGRTRDDSTGARSVRASD